MPEVPIIGKNAESTNPLLILAAAIQEQSAFLMEIAHNTRRESGHQYVIVPTLNEGWGTYCQACSEKAGDFVHPCALSPDAPHPPQFFAIGQRPILDVIPDLPDL